MMLKKSVLLIYCLALTISNQAQDVSFEGYNPKPTLVVPGDSIFKAKFPFIDVHGHQFRMATQDLSLLIDDMDKLNEGIMVNLSGRSGEQLQSALKNVNENYPNRFAVFANIDFEGV